MNASLGSILLTLFLVAPRAAERKPMTVEWIFSDEGEAVAGVPAAFWTTKHDVLLFDSHRPKAERTIERFRAETGVREPAVDRNAALLSLRALLDEKERPEDLGWPVAFDPAGEHAVYSFAGDLFLLDLAAARFSRLTRTATPETLPRFSPDGRKLGFVRDNDIYVVDLATTAETRLTSDGSETILNGGLSWVYWEEVFDHGETGYWWSPDSQSVAFLHSDDSPVSVVPLVDFRPVVPRLLRQRYPKAGGANPSVRLGIAAVDGARVAWVDSSEVPYEYLVRVKWLADSSRVAYETLNRRQDRSDLWLVDRRTGASQHVLTETDPAWVNTSDFQFLANGQELLATSERTGHTHLYRYASTGQLVGAVTQGPWSVRGPAGFTTADLDSSVLDESKGCVYFTALEKSSLERHLYRVGLDGGGLTRLSKEDGVHSVEWSPDRRYYLDVHSSHARLPSLSLHDADGALKAVVGPSHPEDLAPFDIRYPELTTIPAADGFPLPARILKPAGFDARRRHPVILNVYGEPNAPLVADAWDWSYLFDQVLLANGFVVVNVDPRSATGTSKELENLVLRHKNGAVEAGDFEGAARWLKRQPWVDPARLGIWGWSGGGTSTLLALTRTQEFKAGIAVAPETERRYYDTKYVEAYMKTPEENKDGYDDVSLVKRAKDLHGRLLLVFGTGDDNVHPQHSLHFADELIKAGKPFDMMVYPMRKHGIADRDARRHLFNKMLEFWKLSL
jgi:dipeptidyl-peptidase 4